jgi:hypothetical protein
MINNWFGVPIRIMSRQTFLLILLVILVYILVDKLKVIDRLWDRFITKTDSPIISTTDYAKSTGLTDMAMGKMENGDYIYTLKTNNAGRTMMEITMDHDTEIHILAIGARSGIKSKLGYAVNHRWLETVTLEGDFPDDFEMYCTRDGQIEVRQVFDPETMAQFADFCRAYNFEIFDDMMYISVAENADDPRDTTTMVTDIISFIRRNRRVFDNLGDASPAAEPEQEKSPPA